jgi:DNA-binding transcriptional MerR regulator
MSLQSDIERRITRSVQQLVGAARRQIDRWLREGVQFEEIVRRLRAFRLPPAEAKALEETLRSEMNRLAEQRGDVARELADADIERIQAATSISLPKLRDELRSVFAGEIQRAIAARMGVSGLMHALKDKGFGNIETLAHTSIAQFNNELTFAVAEQTGTTTFLYSGPISALTRPFCRAHAGKVFSLVEIDHMDNGQGLPVRTSCGGYNCRHTWIPAPGRSAEQKAEVRTSKMVLLMDKNRATEFFSHERVLWVETQAGKPASWFLTAKPLARVHDGFNEQITNTPSRGVWAPYRLGLNFESHADKAIKEGVVASRTEYAQRLTDIVRNPDAQVYRFSGKSGEERLAMFDPQSTWMLMIDRDGKVHTGLRLGRDARRYWKNKTLLGTASEYIGRFK